ncbi:MAG: hypothetical protein ACXVVK_00530 [Solirubrobacteraceae bacterium]
MNTAPPQIQQPPGAQRQNEVAAPQVGEYLLGNKGTWSGASYYKVQWEDCDNVGLPTQTCTAAAGSPSTNTTYQVAQGDVGHALVFLVTATSSPGSSTALASAPSGVVANGVPLNRVGPVISGNTQDGQTLSVTSGTWDGSLPMTFGYQWRRCDGAGLNCGQALPAPPGPSGTRPLTDADLGHTLVAYVTATNAAGSASTHSHTTTTVVTPGNTGAPTISGDAQSGKTLTESHGGWIPKNPSGYVYQWQECDASGSNCASIAKATAQTYALTNADAGHTLRVLESATASGVTGSPATSAATGVVKASSTAGGGTGGGSGGSGGSGGTGGTGGTAGGQGGSGGSVTLSVSKLRALLHNVLAVHGKAGTIRGVLNHAGYSFSFAAPSSGRLVMGWYATPKHGKKVLVATVTLVFHSSGLATAKILLTTSGRRLLSGTRRMHLTAKGTFTPAGHRAVSVSRQITLKA